MHTYNKCIIDKMYYLMKHENKKNREIRLKKILSGVLFQTQFCSLDFPEQTIGL